MKEVKDRRITKPQHVRQVLTEQINILRQPESSKEERETARAISYVCNTILMAMRDGEVNEKLAAIEEKFDQIIKENQLF